MAYAIFLGSLTYFLFSSYYFRIFSYYSCLTYFLVLVLFYISDAFWNFTISLTFYFILSFLFFYSSAASFYLAFFFARSYRNCWCFWNSLSEAYLFFPFAPLAYLMIWRSESSLARLIIALLFKIVYYSGNTLPYNESRLLDDDGSEDDGSL